MAYCRVTNCTIQLTHIALHRRHWTTAAGYVPCHRLHWIANLSAARQCQLLVIRTDRPHWPGDSRAAAATYNCRAAQSADLENVSFIRRIEMNWSNLAMGKCWCSLSFPLTAGHCLSSAGLNLNFSPVAWLTGSTCWCYRVSVPAVMIYCRTSSAVCPPPSATPMQSSAPLWLVSSTAFHWAITDTKLADTAAVILSVCPTAISRKQVLPKSHRH